MSTEMMFFVMMTNMWSCVIVYVTLKNTPQQTLNKNSQHFVGS